MSAGSKRLRDLLAVLALAAAALFASAVLSAAELAGDDPVANKNFDHFVPPGFERAYLEAKGELPD